MRDNQPHQVFGDGCEFCSETGRPYERGSGSLSKEQQTAQFVQDRDRASELPKYESDVEARQRVRNEMQARGATADEIAAVLAITVGGPEKCVFTGREFEHGSGCLPKSIQTRQFLEELAPAEKAQRRAAAAALAEMPASGRA